MKQIIHDTDSSVDYGGSWVLNSTTIVQNEKTVTLTSHSTAQNLSTVFIPFNGSQIHVIGVTPTGAEPLVVNYTVDNGQPTSMAEPFLSQNSSLQKMALFESPILPIGLHNLTIQVLKTGVDRNYTLQEFIVMSGQNSMTSVKVSGSKRGNNIAAVAIGVLSTTVFLLAMVLGIIFIRRRRRRILLSRQVDSEKSPVHPDTEGAVRRARRTSRVDFDVSGQEHRTGESLYRRSSIAFGPAFIAPEVNPSFLYPRDTTGETLEANKPKISFQVARPESVNESITTSLPPYTPTVVQPGTIPQAGNNEVDCDYDSDINPFEDNGKFRCFQPPS